MYKRVDTCAAEFVARTPYLYSTYETETESDIARRRPPPDHPAGCPMVVAKTAARWSGLQSVPIPLRKAGMHEERFLYSCFPQRKSGGSFRTVALNEVESYGR